MSLCIAYREPYITSAMEHYPDAMVIHKVHPWTYEHVREHLASGKSIVTTVQPYYWFPPGTDYTELQGLLQNTYDIVADMLVEPDCVFLKYC